MKNVLIALTVYSTPENGKDEQLRRTLASLDNTVDFDRHKLIISVNGRTETTDTVLNMYSGIIDLIIDNKENIGTAKAINRAWLHREIDQHCIKMDDDVVIHSKDWVEEMIEAISIEPKIGIIGLKRKDLIENTNHPDTNYRSQLIQLPHEPGARWIVIERARGIMGTCKMVNSKLIDKIGYLYQPSVYGFDDSIYSFRSDMAGFINCFLPHINIDHIDPGGTDYTEWKRVHAGEKIAAANALVLQYANGERPIYEAP